VIAGPLIIPAMERLNVALLGAGTVGAAFLKLLSERRERFEALAATINLTGILVRDPTRERPEWVPKNLLTTDAEAVLRDAEVVVELMGGLGRAFELVEYALGEGIPVITANKHMLAEAWDDLRPYAEDGMLYYEAAVMAGTPAVEILAGALRGNYPLEVHAVLNGTTSYILARMEAGHSFGDALAEAQAKGYAEAEPLFDVAGLDAAHKLTVIARLVADPEFPWEAVRANTRGITHLKADEVMRAADTGTPIRLVASLYGEGGAWRAAVRPVRVPKGHPLATPGVQNALLFRGDAVGEVVLTGPGAGGVATAGAVLADLVRLIEGYPGHTPVPAPVPAPSAPHTVFEEVE